MGINSKRKGVRSMKVGAMVLGLLGGLWGFFDSVFAVTIGEAGGALKAPVAVTGGDFVAIFLAIIGIVGASLSIDRPLIASIVMIIGGIASLIFMSAGFVIAAPLLILGSIFAFSGYMQEKTRPEAEKEMKGPKIKKVA